MIVIDFLYMKISILNFVYFSLIGKQPAPWGTWHPVQPMRFSSTRSTRTRSLRYKHFHCSQITYLTVYCPRKQWDSCTNIFTKKCLGIQRTALGTVFWYFVQFRFWVKLELRLYQVQNTSSHKITEVTQRGPQLALKWATIQLLKWMLYWKYKKNPRRGETLPPEHAPGPKKDDKILYFLFYFQAYISTNFTTTPNTPGRFIVWFRNETTLLVLWQPPYPAGFYTDYKERWHTVLTPV